jgi:hypothetical protein
MTTVASVYANGLVKTFGELRAVDDIDLNHDVEAGDRLASRSETPQTLISPLSKSYYRVDAHLPVIGISGQGSTSRARRRVWSGGDSDFAVTNATRGCG